MVEDTNSNKVVLSLVMGVFLLLGTSTLFFILSTAYFSFLIHALGGPFPDDMIEFLKNSVICAFCYLVAYSVWNLGRRKEPSFDKTGRKLFSVSLFAVGIIFFLFIVSYINGIGMFLLELEMWVHIGFGAIAFGLMGVAVYIWRKTRTPGDTTG